jgi:hypothetical protein
VKSKRHCQLIFAGWEGLRTLLDKLPPVGSTVQPTQALKLNPSAHRRLVSAGAILVVALTSCQSGPILPGNAPAAAPYTCGTLSSGHCYAELLVDPGHLRGYRTQILVTTQLAPGNGFIDNEFWLNPYGGTGWLEMGYEYHPVYRMTYFWAEDRQDGYFIAHEIADVDPLDDGNYATFDIHETATDTFSISLTSKKVSYSYSNTNFPLFGSTASGWVAMGQELAGTTGAQAPFVLYLFNTYYDTNLAKHYITGGTPVLAKPPYGGWLQAPASGNQGGAWSTWCCAP